MMLNKSKNLAMLQEKPKKNWHILINNNRTELKGNLMKDVIPELIICQQAFHL